MERLGTAWFGTIFELDGVCIEYECGDGGRSWQALAAEEEKQVPPLWALKKARGMKNEQVRWPAGTLPVSVQPGVSARPCHCHSWQSPQGWPAPWQSAAAAMSRAACSRRPLLALPLTPLLLRALGPRSSTGLPRVNQVGFLAILLPTSCSQLTLEGRS